MTIEHFFADRFIHPWIGTQHCLRESECCLNDHTGCLWNDGNNGCGHPAPFQIVSPLLTKKYLDFELLRLLEDE